jgi:anaerobic selenocysteine-containing dehydrogenase
VEPLTNLADVLLPGAAWYEQEGHTKTLLCEEKPRRVIVQPENSVGDVADVYGALATTLGQEFKATEFAICGCLFIGEEDPQNASPIKIEEV